MKKEAKKIASSNLRKLEKLKSLRKPKINKWLYWTPRVLSILFLLFLALFSLDVFDSCNNFLTCAGGLLIHNLPVVVLAILLWFAWKRELVGAITFVIAGLLYIGLILYNIISNGLNQLFTIFWTLPISLPCFVVAFLWYLNYKKKK